MAVTSVSIQATLNNITNTIVVQDTTDYAGQGVPLDNTFTIEGRLAVYLTSATGTTTIYNNIGGVSPDILPNSSSVNLISISLPQDSDGNVLNGTYSFVYEVDITPPVDPAYSITSTTNYDYDMELPTVCLTVSVNCVSSMVTSFDETDYGSYVTSLSRQHTLYPPNGSPMANVVGTTATLIAGPNIYDKTWTQEIISNVTYTFPDGLIVVLQVQGSREFEVICDLGLSKIYCCLDKLFKKYDNIQCKNPVRASEMYENTIKPTETALMMYKAALDAGDTNKATYWYNEIIERSGCGEDCGCTSPGPNQVYPALATVGQFVVDSPDASIAVVPEVIGNVTYYHIQVSAAIQQILSNFYLVTVSTATPTYLTIVQTGTFPNRNYEVNYVGPTAGVINEQNILIIIDGTTDGVNYLSWNSYDKGSQGTEIQPWANQAVALGQTVPNQSTDLAIITITDVPVTPANRFIVFAQINKSNSTLIPTNVKNLECEVLYVDFTTGNITLRLYNPQNGNTYTLSDLRSGAFDFINIAVKIVA